MNKPYQIRLLLILLTFYLIWMVINSAPVLPEKIASHFDLEGQPNGWQDKNTFIIIFCILFAAMGGMFVFISWVLSVSPPELINIPNRNYWLGAEQKLQTIYVLQIYILWYAIFLQVFLGYIAHNIILFNTRPVQQTTLTATGPMLLFGTVTIIWMVFIFRRFRKPR